MACNAYISMPSNGQSVFMPLNWSGGAMGSLSPGGGAAANITAASSQLDNHDLVPLTPSFGSYGTSSVMFQVALTGLDPNSWHTLTLYVWDSQSTNATTVSVTFQVIALPPLP